MPRKARQRSKTGIYHVIIRGINRQDIFHDDEDKTTYLERLTTYKNQCEFELYAYCLMDNHVHLLLKEGTESLSGTMKRIGASYVYWYNWKYDRIGHLFQDRYKSEPVEDERYLLSVVRYIHQNPIKVGLCIDNWTSYNNYIGSSDVASIVDIHTILKLFSHDMEIAQTEFRRYVNEANDDMCLDISERRKVTEKEMEEIAKRLGITSFQELQQMDKHRRNSILKELRDTGMSIRQIERITGINRGTIYKA